MLLLKTTAGGGGVGVRADAQFYTPLSQHQTIGNKSTWNMGQIHSRQQCRREGWPMCNCVEGEVGAGVEGGGHHWVMRVDRLYGDYYGSG